MLSAVEPLAQPAHAPAPDVLFQHCRRVDELRLARVLMLASLKKFGIHEHISGIKKDVAVTRLATRV